MYHGIYTCKDIESIDLTWETWLRLFMNVVDKHISNA